MSIFHHSETVKTLLAPQAGTVIPLAKVPDPVFSGKILGDGAAIAPSSDGVFAPVSGTVVQIAKTLHAVCLKSDDGLELLIHLGLDTVKLGGKGFICHVKSDQHVSAGELLMDMDLNYIRAAGYNPITPCVITNMNAIAKLTVHVGEAAAGKTAIMTYRLS